jgi:Protein of unknown function (DUF4235)
MQQQAPSRSAKIIYRPFGFVLSLVAGIIASTLFKRIWKRASDKDETPKPRESQYGWRELLAAVALQGAVFALVKAIVDRGGAQAFQKLTGSWPGD